MTLQELVQIATPGFAMFGFLAFVRCSLLQRAIDRMRERVATLEKRAP